MYDRTPDPTPAGPEPRDWFALAERAVSAIEAIAASLMERPREGGLNIIHGLDDLISPEHLSPAVIVEERHEMVDDTLDSAASLAQEAEALLNAAATPRVRSQVDVGEGEKPKSASVKINLFQQSRKDIAELVETCADDPLIKIYIRLRDNAKTTEETNTYRVFGAAVSLVYDHLPVELWGSDTAAQAVKQFVAQHSEDA